MSRWMDKMGLLTAGFALGGLSLGFLMTWLLGPSTFDGLPALLLERVRGETPQARVARIRVQFLDQDDLPVVTIFDVLHREGGTGAPRRVIRRGSGRSTTSTHAARSPSPGATPTVPGSSG